MLRIEVLETRGSREVHTGLCRSVYISWNIGRQGLKQEYRLGGNWNDQIKSDVNSKHSSCRGSGTSDSYYCPHQAVLNWPLWDFPYILHYVHILDMCICICVYIILYEEIINQHIIRFYLLTLKLFVNNRPKKICVSTLTSGNNESFEVIITRQLNMTHKRTEQALSIEQFGMNEHIWLQPLLGFWGSLKIKIWDFCWSI